MARHTALWQDILTSSIWGESDRTRIVFITMLASADEHGVVHASAGGLAHLARVSVEETSLALSVLASPDPDSRTSDHEGRRIEKVEGGWRLLNYEKYQQRDPEPKKRVITPERREYMRKLMAERRKAAPPKPAAAKQEDLTLQGEQEPKEAKAPNPKDVYPTTPEAIFCAELYRRKLTTAWSPKEIKAFRDGVRRGLFTEENMALLKSYYAQEMPLGDNGQHRRDLQTFLNNLDGEIDRARARSVNNQRRAPHGTNAHPKSAAASAANSGTSNANHARKY